MNCRTCQYELSQCLDGRLPSGRRAVVMEHAESCEPCSRFWSDLQHAQQLVLRLRTQSVCAGFREQLFERIAAGEGTPPAVFHEPIPLATKVRYVLTGAAAAAAMLLVLNLTRSKPPASPSDATVASAPKGRAPIGYDPAEAVSTSPTATLLSGMKPLTTETWAVEATKYWKASFDSANRNVARLETDGNPDEVTVRLVLESAVELQEVGQLLLDLYQHEQIFFATPEVPVELDRVVSHFDPKRLHARNADPGRDVAVVLRGLRHLGGIDSQIGVKPTIDAEDQQLFVQRLSLRHSGLFQRMFVDLSSNAGGFRSLAPDQFGQAFAFHSDCGPILVLIRRGR